ncbi:hypothetical protein IT400_03940 [Candidatus Nomurabacteria bacterium]|nr:hypothetical protein [Candidatus Nomurabacteria bacterium]
MESNKINVLWDIKEEDRVYLPQEFIIKRTLVYGGFSLIQNVAKEYGIKKTKSVLGSIKESELGKKRAYFLKEYLFS